MNESDFFPEMLCLPRETILVILNYIDYNQSAQQLTTIFNYPHRRDILQLFRTCKKFSWLEELWITTVKLYNFESYHITYNIFGFEIGPCYKFSYNNDYTYLEDLSLLIEGRYSEWMTMDTILYEWSISDVWGIKNKILIRFPVNGYPLHKLKQNMYLPFKI